MITLSDFKRECFKSLEELDIEPTLRVEVLPGWATSHHDITYGWKECDDIGKSIVISAVEYSPIDCVKMIKNSVDGLVENCPGKNIRKVLIRSESQKINFRNYNLIVEMYLVAEKFTENEQLAKEIIT